jgi:hypothetical protein
VSKSLTALELSTNGLLTKAAGSALGSMLPTNSLLRELDISNNFESTTNPNAAEFCSELAAGLEANQALTYLNVNNCMLTRGIQTGGESGSSTDGWADDPNVTFEIDMVGVIALVNVLRINTSALVALHLCNINLVPYSSPGELELSGIRALNEALKENVSVVVRTCSLPFPKMRLSIVCGPLQRTVMTLDLRQNGLAFKEAGEILADALKTNHSLRNLDVSNNLPQHEEDTTIYNGYAFAYELADGLPNRKQEGNKPGMSPKKKRRGLRCLDLTENGIPQKHCKSIADKINAKGVDKLVLSPFPRSATKSGPQQALLQQEVHPRVRKRSLTL